MLLASGLALPCHNRPVAIDMATLVCKVKCACLVPPYEQTLCLCFQSSDDSRTIGTARQSNIVLRDGTCEALCATLQARHVQGSLIIVLHPEQGSIFQKVTRPKALEVGQKFCIGDHHFAVVRRTSMRSTSVEEIFSQEIELARVLNDGQSRCYLCQIDCLRNGARTNDRVIVNPCGRCVGSSRFVHLTCLLEWIDKTQSRHCSVCKEGFPSRFAPSREQLEIHHAVSGSRACIVPGLLEESYAFFVRKDGTVQLEESMPDTIGKQATLWYDSRMLQFMICGNNVCFPVLHPVAIPTNEAVGIEFHTGCFTKFNISSYWIELPERKTNSLMILGTLGLLCALLAQFCYGLYCLYSLSLSSNGP